MAFWNFTDFKRLIGKQKLFKKLIGKWKLLNRLIGK
jgi:hypothetical protein